ncbi:MAG: hypothetical protein GYB31_14570 [Bacteroidetes bacterium]|nr:hypothetical protein [Bacteroidota bacterium]
MILVCGACYLGHKTPASEAGLPLNPPSEDVARQVRIICADQVPIFDSLFIACDGNKWGIVDGAGKEVVPFICDGIKQTGENRAVISVYRGSYSLNTGIPRYVYQGTWYFVGVDGKRKSRDKKFGITVEFVADFHQPWFVIEQGPSFYLPEDLKK